VLSTVLPSETIWDWLAYGMIVTGFLLIVTGCLGMVAFNKKHRKLLTLYNMMMVLTFIGVALFVGLPLWYREQVNKDLYGNMEDSIYYYSGEQATDHHSVFWNYVQVYHRCCGVDMESDYDYVPWVSGRTLNQLFIPNMGNITRQYPASCCEYYSSGKERPTLSKLKKGTWEINPVHIEDCYANEPSPNPPFSYVNGCYRKIKDMLTTNMTLMGSIACGLSVIMILLFLMACFVIAVYAPIEV